MPGALVLGAGGLLGSEVFSECTRRRLRTVATAGVFTWDDPERLSRQVESVVGTLMHDEAGDDLLVFWCAGVGYVGSGDGTAPTAGAALRACLRGLEGVRESGTNVHLTYASSAGAVWSGASAMPVSESTPPAAVHDYGESKLAEEELVQTWASHDNSSCTIARISNLFGRKQNPSKNQGLLTKLVASSISGEPTRLFVPLDTCRDYLPATSAAAMLVADGLESCDHLERPPIRIFASGRAYTIAQVCGILQRMRRRRVPVAHVISENTSKQPLRLTFRTERPIAGIVIPSLEESLRTMFEDESRRLALSA